MRTISLNDIKILIADDQLEKRKDIERVVLNKFPFALFEHSVSYNSTARKLKTESYDIIILDMSMPNFDPKEGSRPTLKALAGKEIMYKMKYRGIKIPVIVVTQFDIFGRHLDALGIDDLVSDLENNFPEFFVACIFYNTQSASWETELVFKISELMNG